MESMEAYIAQGILGKKIVGDSCGCIRSQLVGFTQRYHRELLRKYPVLCISLARAVTWRMLGLLYLLQ